MEEPRFSLKLKSQTVTILDAIGQDKGYTVRELSGCDMEEYLDSVKDRVITAVDDNGKVRVVGFNTFKGMYVSLLALCLYDENSKLVGKEIIKRWPTSVQRGLFEIAQTLNGLEEEGLTKAKNV